LKNSKKEKWETALIVQIRKVKDQKVEKSRQCSCFFKRVEELIQDRKSRQESKKKPKIRKMHV